MDSVFFYRLISSVCFIMAGAGIHLAIKSENDLLFFVIVVLTIFLFVIMGAYSQHRLVEEASK